MAKRPTIALTLIAKNEEHNLPVLLKSVEGCFDEIWLTDTGSTDKTVETFVSIGIEHHEKYGTSFHVVNFDWIDDFSAARNAALESIKTDFWAWFDLDDSLDNKESFIDWRDNAMRFGNYFLANYHYAVDEKMNPVISFIRERVFKNGMGYKFSFPVHEGVRPVHGTQAANIITWSVKHRRTQEDLTKDKGRNLRILEKNKLNLDSRLKFYYGKELFENGKSEDAVPILKDVVVIEDLELHDRIMSYQYLCLSIMAESEKLKRPEYDNKAHEMYFKAISLAYQGLQLDPKRAEFWTMIGDCYLKMGRVADALPMYSAAKSLTYSSNSIVSEPNHRVKNVYQEYPRNMIAKIHYNMGKLDEAILEVDECLKLYPESKDALEVKAELMKISPLIDLKSKKEQVPDIVITCPPHDLMEWDSEVYKHKKIGGSETAVVEMSQWIRRLTNRPVKVFNVRKEAFTDDVGVEYIPNTKINEYMSQFEPAIHIAHRHNIKVTNAKTYLWCHDLMTPGCEFVHNFDNIFALSPFHKRYLNALQGIPKDKIVLTRNGIKPDRFKNKHHDKNPNKVVFPSSPDRGLAEAIYIVEKARKELPDLELHAYYGFENLRKCGLAPLADKLEGLIAERPWVKYHGGVQQDVLAKELGEAVVWLYPAVFIESFAITALEAICSGTYPLVRDIGALPDTLKEASSAGMATVVDLGVETEMEQQEWADLLVKIIKEQTWKTVEVNPDDYSWQSVARSWIKLMEL